MPVLPSEPEPAPEPEPEDETAAVEVPELGGEHVGMRPFDADDAALVLRAAADPAIARLIDVDGPEAARAYAARQRLRADRGLGASFAILAPDGRAVGQHGLWLRGPAPDGSTGYREESHGRAAFGWWVEPAARGYGYASAALELLAAWALALPDVERLEVFIEPANTASLRTAERAGFVREGLLRSFQRIGDERRDMVVLSRLPDPVTG